MNTTQQEQNISLSPEERKQFEAFKKHQAEMAKAEKDKQDRETYKTMIDEELNQAIAELKDISQNLKAVKDAVYKRFSCILDLKEQLFCTKNKSFETLRSHRFTNSASTKRITLGNYVIDDYRDTVEDGIAMVKEYITDLARDDKTKTLVNMVLKLLSRDSKGTLKASRIVQLRKIAQEIGDEKFLKGVDIIEESYQPQTSKTFIRAEEKGENGAWLPITLSITES